MRCSVLLETTQTACPYDAVTDQLCLIHHLRRVVGWSDDELTVAFGHGRPYSPRLCPQIMDSGAPCGREVVSRGLCSGHRARVRAGRSEEMMGRPFERVAAATGCSVLMHDTGKPCGRAVRSNGMCVPHQSRSKIGWTAERMGLPIRHRRPPRVKS